MNWLKDRKNYYKDQLSAKDRLGRGEADIKLFMVGLLLVLVFVGLIVMAATKLYGL